MGERAISFSRRPSTLAVASALAFAFAALMLLAPAASAKKAKYDVQVTRDKAGIPHIEAGDFRSLGYGQGYSYAQDNLCLFADAIVTVRGERTQRGGQLLRGDIDGAIVDADADVLGEGLVDARRQTVRHGVSEYREESTHGPSSLIQRAASSAK